MMLTKTKIECSRASSSKTSPSMRGLHQLLFLRVNFCIVSTKTRSGNNQSTPCFLCNQKCSLHSDRTSTNSRDKTLCLLKTSICNKSDISLAKRISQVVSIETHNPSPIYLKIAMGLILYLKKVLKQVITIVEILILIHLTIVRIILEV
jgi:hypothetical protein